jgi:hypothetical protein
MKIIKKSGGGGVTPGALASAINSATEDTLALATDQLPMTETAASGALRRLTFANLFAFIRAQLGLMSGAVTAAGNWEFPSTARPTSAGTGTPAANSLITRADGDARYPASQTKICSRTDSVSSAFVDVIGWTGWVLEPNAWYKIEVCASVTVTSGLMYWALTSTEDLDFTTNGITGAGLITQPNGNSGITFRNNARMVFIWVCQSVQTARLGSCYFYFRTGAIAPTVKIQVNQPGTPSGTASIFDNGIAVISRFPN